MLQGERVFGESVWCQQWLALRGGTNELPPALLTTRAKEGFSFLLFAFTQDTKPVSKMQKKNMDAILKTTSRNAAEVSPQEDRKPDVILDYNINKGEGDNLDKVTGTYVQLQEEHCLWPLMICNNITAISTSAHLQRLFCTVSWNPPEGQWGGTGGGHFWRSLERTLRLFACSKHKHSSFSSSIGEASAAAWGWNSSRVLTRGQERRKCNWKI